MGISFEGSLARFSGQCAVEEAGELTEWLLADRSRRIDLSGCEGLHASILQTVMALRPPLAAGPVDPTLSRWLSRVLPPIATASEDGAAGPAAAEPDLPDAAAPADARPARTRRTRGAKSTPGSGAAGRAKSPRRTSKADPS
ncbi:hypothetical protein [Novosphingobium huizhouense]|uniref:hypothetical protein n=1 Tax=Novosphingobium huizhouense TaxID=2866625 RepID=UPI001CD8CD07|nr:hypothetical protein [Novosphingobium huizhouense]